MLWKTFSLINQVDVIDKEENSEIKKITLETW